MINAKNFLFFCSIYHRFTADTVKNKIPHKKGMQDSSEKKALHGFYFV